MWLRGQAAIKTSASVGGAAAAAAAVVVVVVAAVHRRTDGRTDVVGHVGSSNCDDDDDGGHSTQLVHHRTLPAGRPAADELLSENISVGRHSVITIHHPSRPQAGAVRRPRTTFEQPAGSYSPSLSLSRSLSLEPSPTRELRCLLLYDATPCSGFRYCCATKAHVLHGTQRQPVVVRAAASSR